MFIEQKSPELMDCVNGQNKRSMLNIFKFLAVSNLKPVYAVWQHFTNRVSKFIIIIPEALYVSWLYHLYIYEL